MTVAELILELQYQPQNLEVAVVDWSKSKYKEHREMSIQILQPELADNFVCIYLNAPDDI